VPLSALPPARDQGHFIFFRRPTPGADGNVQPSMNGWVEARVSIRRREQRLNVDGQERPKKDFEGLIQQLGNIVR